MGSAACAGAALGTSAGTAGAPIAAALTGAVGLGASALVDAFGIGIGLLAGRASATALAGALGLGTSALADAFGMGIGLLAGRIGCCCGGWPLAIQEGGGPVGSLGILGGGPSDGFGCGSPGLAEGADAGLYAVGAALGPKGGVGGCLGTAGFAYTVNGGALGGVFGLAMAGSGTTSAGALIKRLRCL